MPGMLAFFENAILNDATPVIGIKNEKGIAYVSIGQIDRASGGRLAIFPLAYDHGIGIAPKLGSRFVVERTRFQMNQIANTCTGL